MPSIKSQLPPLFIGIDGGGSKCKAVVMTADHQILGTGIAGPGNPLHGFEQATNSIIDCASLALTDAGLSRLPLSSIHAGVGLAGVNLPAIFQQMSTWQHPFLSMQLATDLSIACLGAHEGADGAVIITGTGSCGFACVDGKEFIIGAHGFPHGDKGSGAWFGLQAAKQVLLSLDGLVANTLLTAQLMALLGCSTDTDLVEVIAHKPATFYAQFANLVLDAADQGDVIATAIVTEGADYIDHVAKRLWQQQPKRMSIIGGLSARITPWLAPQVQQQLSTPLNPPEVGAVFFAEQQLAALF